MKKQSLSLLLVFSFICPLSANAESFIRGLMPCTRQFEDARDDMFHESYKKKFLNLHKAQQALSDEKFDIARNPFPLRVLNLSYGTLRKMAKERPDIPDDQLKKDLQKEIDENQKALGRIIPEGSSITVVDLKMGDEPTVEMHITKPNGTVFKFSGQFASSFVHYDRATLKSADKSVHKRLEELDIDTKGVTLEEGIMKGFKKIGHLRDIEIVERELVSKRCVARLMEENDVYIADIQDPNVIQEGRKNSKDIDKVGENSEAVIENSGSIR